MAIHLTEAGAYPQLPTQPNFFILFKLIQQSNMVILSCLAKKNQNLNLRKKSSVYYWKLHFQGRNAHKPPFSVINWTFFPQIQISIFLREATQNDHIRLLYKFETEHFFFGCVGSCGYAAASVKKRWSALFGHSYFEVTKKFY